ncbi:MAG: VIT family protein, partial [Alphaproteobacteria bacterium]
MSQASHQPEHHFVHRIGWLRAAVLGANDGIVSTASLIVGVAAASADRETILIAGIAGLVAGATAMAAGEYVSVSSQSDTERADLETERQAIEASPETEREELAQIYVERGLEQDFAREVATQLMAHDALGAHARDELGMHETGAARPMQAAWTSAAMFSIGAGLPLFAVALAPV